MHFARSLSIVGHSSWPRLLADIGGTHARLAWLSRPDADLSDLRILLCDPYQGPIELIRDYLAQSGRPNPECAAIAVACPVSSDRVQMTNRDWQFSVESLRAALGLQGLIVLNDYAALAIAVPKIPPNDILPLHGPLPLAQPGRGSGGPVGLIGPGTGLGVSGLIPGVGGEVQSVPLIGEGGHATLFAESELECSVLGWLRRRYGHVSAERVLSGTGLVNLFQALMELRGRSINGDISPAQVLADGQSRLQPEATQALDLFCGWLGAVAGNLALIMGATGGIYIGGGIAPRMYDFLVHSSFRHRFVAKGRFQSYLEAIPTWLIKSPHTPALHGAAQALEWHIRPQTSSSFGGISEDSCVALS